MKEGAADIADALLPPEDGAVTRALSDLKAKLSTWSTAVANVQGALAAQAAKLAQIDAATVAQGEARGRESENESNDRDAAISVAEPIASTVEDQDDGNQGQPYAKEASPTEEDGDGSTVPTQSLSEQIKRSQETAQDPAGEDQALLQSLDDKMAAAIRVQFRLFDGRKSIRELIDEYEEEPEELQKSWWQRVKG